LVDRKINGVDVTPAVTSELKRINPERAHAADRSGRMRRAECAERWEATIERDQASEATLHESVNGEFRSCRRCGTWFAIDKWFAVPSSVASSPDGLLNTEFEFRPGMIVMIRRLLTLRRAPRRTTASK
jgi:hypothetical protein